MITTKLQAKWWLNWCIQALASVCACISSLHDWRLHSIGWNVVCHANALHHFALNSAHCIHHTFETWIDGQTCIELVTQDWIFFN